MDLPFARSPARLQGSPIVGPGRGLAVGPRLDRGSASPARILVCDPCCCQRSSCASLGLRRGGLSTALIEAQAVDATERAKLIDLRESISAGPALACLALGIVSLLATCGRDLGDMGHRSWCAGFEGLRRSAGHWHVLGSGGRARSPGDIELTYFYPAHTHLAQRTVAGTNGDIDAPAGTQVSLRTRADRAVKQADLVVNGTPLALSISGDRALAGSFVVSHPGSYFFRFGPASHPIAEGPPIAIAVQVDGPPQISLQSPPEELEVEPKEVLDLRYQASDDYGLSEIRLVYRLPGAEKETSVSLRKPAEQPLRLDGTAQFDLGPLHLMAGDRLSYALEASDNDDVQGPKVGRSRAHILKIFSPAEHHRDALARVRALWERLVQLLGDRLEEASSAGVSRDVDARALQLCQDFEQEAQHLLKDQKQEKGIAVALRNVARGERRRASASADERGGAWGIPRPRARRLAPPSNQPRRALADEIEGLERDVLYLEALLDQATNEDLFTLSRELAARRRELSELLERYRKNPTPELKDKVNALFNRLKTRSAELASRMQELAKGLTNQPHLNLEALPKGFESNLSQVEQALASADIDQALKFLDQLGSQLDQPSGSSSPTLAAAREKRTGSSRTSSRNSRTTSTPCRATRRRSPTRPIAFAAKRAKRSSGEPPPPSRCWTSFAPKLNVRKPNSTWFPRPGLRATATRRSRKPRSAPRISSGPPTGARHRSQEPRRSAAVDRRA